MTGDTCSLLYTTPKGEAIQLFNTWLSTIGALAVIQDSLTYNQTGLLGQPADTSCTFSCKWLWRAGKKGARHNEKVTNEYLSPKGKIFWLGFSAGWAEKPCSLTPHFKSCNFICAQGCSAGASAEVMGFPASQPALSWHLCSLPPQSYPLWVTAHSPCGHQVCSMLLPVFQESWSPLLLPSSLTCILSSFWFLSPFLSVKQWILSQSGFHAKNFMRGKGRHGKQATKRSFLRDLTFLLCSCILKKSRTNEEQSKTTTKIKQWGLEVTVSWWA